jgi:hypothetical protein
VSLLPPPGLRSVSSYVGSSASIPFSVSSLFVARTGFGSGRWWWFFLGLLLLFGVALFASTVLTVLLFPLRSALLRAVGSTVWALADAFLGLGGFGLSTALDVFYLSELLGDVLIYCFSGNLFRNFF